ncbi:hypothetical protein CIPAW_02G198600 [Carya illinoinensis]|uniref:Reticulon-like protein n=1 Tax=Carya illinoinensis TaxID=32201 RepID=A0A8T1RG32_CARIL|nr:hypothetical protein CIPAW_02G198600 [Carya illinoinensis]
MCELNSADVLLWKRQNVSFGIIVVTTVAWLLLEWSGLSLLSIYSDVLLILIVLLFLHANYAIFRDRQLETLSELVLSEEMVNNTVASFRVKINSMLLMAHGCTLGRDFRLFFKARSILLKLHNLSLLCTVVICLWLLSVIDSYFSFFTLTYIVTIIPITVPALYSKYEEHVDRCCGMTHQQFSKHYKIVDESVISRLGIFRRTRMYNSDSLVSVR